MSEDYNVIETYATEMESLERISQLRARGLPENTIYVVSENPEDAAKLTDQTDVHFQSAEGSFKEKFASFFSKEGAEEKTLEKLNVSEAQKEQYAQDLRDGMILLYADTSDEEE